MSDSENSNSIDRELRDVALPPGMLERLRAIAGLGDAELDHLIRDVAPPDGVLNRLREIGSLSDADIDAGLRDVSLPEGLQARLQYTVRRETTRTRWRILFAVAASLLAVVGGATYWVGRGNQLAQLPAPRQDGGPNNQEVVGVKPPSPVDPRISPRPKAPLPSPPIETPGVENNPPLVVRVPPNPTPSPQIETDRGLYAGAPEPAPADLKVVAPLIPHGIPGPRVQQYDVPFELRHAGAHPFAVPAANKALLESRVPIWTGTASFEEACRLAHKRTLPAASSIHTEDFLAAMDYGFPPPTESPIGIRAAAGPSPFGPTGMSLLQIGVQAGKTKAPMDRVSLKVTFHPDAVAEYRLIGHEATDLGGLTGAPLEATLKSGETATALYELELKPDGPEQVALVEVSWLDPDTKKIVKSAQTISRQQFVPSWREMPLSLQMAALAAETAEILRGSPYTPSATHSLDQVAGWAGQVNPALASRPGFVRLKQFIDEARVAKPAGSNSARGDGT